MVIFLPKISVAVERLETSFRARFLILSDRYTSRLCSLAMPSSAAPSMYPNMGRGRRFFAICRRSSILQRASSSLFMAHYPSIFPAQPQPLFSGRDGDFHQRVLAAELHRDAGARGRILAVDPGD